VIVLAFELVSSKKMKKHIEKLTDSIKLKLADLFIKFKENPVPADEFDVVKISGS
jgi:hypothetical protein